MPDGLTPTRLRELIAAATPGPWERHLSHISAFSNRALIGQIEGPLLAENSDLILCLVNNAPALADDIEKARMLEWALTAGLVSRMTKDEWDDWRDEAITSIDALRAAKEAADGKI